MSQSSPGPKALLLAAGLGIRLRPLTAHLPKPLLPVCGQPVAARTLDTLAAVGCQAAAVNLHHLGDQVRAAFGDYHDGIELTYSEEPTILGTLGALYPLQDFFADASAILLVNGDALCSWPWKALLKRHFASGADATLLLSRSLEVEAYGGGVGRSADGRVVQFRDGAAAAPIASRHVFTGAHVLSPRLLSQLKPGFGDIIAGLYMPMLANGGHIEGVLSGRRWHDLGTPARYLAGCLDWTRGGRLASGWPRRKIAPSAQVDDSARIRRSVVEADCEIGPDTKIEDSVILSGAHVAAGTWLKDSLVGPGVHLPKGRISGRMVCNLPAHEPIEPGSTLLGELVYTPLDSRGSATLNIGQKGISDS